MRVRLLGFLALGPVCALLAQNATVTGIVTDPVNSVVPAANVQIRNTDTNITRDIQTNQSGSFTITNLPPGVYELMAEMQGFHRYRKTDIILEVGQVLRADIQLAVGSVSDSVVVTAEAAALNTEKGAAKGDVIVQQEIQDLPLDGRNFTDLALLVPGALPSAEGDQGSELTIGGARAESTNFYVDGFSTRDARTGRAQVPPNIGGVQEFKMEVAGFSAEYGRMAGGILNVVMRSGTNQYHGEVFEYIRNNVIDARAFFDQDKLKLNRHQFGATFHGPVQLPGLYNGRDRTFFMFSWESFRQIVGVTSITNVPSLLERDGDFSQSFSQTGGAIKLTDPLSKAPFPDNRIPASRVHPIAAKLMPYYPLPNRINLGNNYLTARNTEENWDSFIIKADHRINEKNSFTYRYQNRSNRGFSPFTSSATGVFGTGNDDKGSLMGLDYIHMFTPAFLVELHTGYSRAKQYLTGDPKWEGRNMNIELGLEGSPPDPALAGWPFFSLPGYATIGTANNLPNRNSVTDIQNNVRFTWAKSRHAMKWGFDDSHLRYNIPYISQIRGQHWFTGVWSSAPLADFELGMMSSSARLIGLNRNYLRATSRGAFFTDDFKLLPNLTLNLGLRYEVDMPPHDRYGHYSMFLPNVGKIVHAGPPTPTAEAMVERARLHDFFTYASSLGLSREIIKPDYNNLAPRFGFAWSPWKDRKTVLRGGYGIFYTGSVLEWWQVRFAATFPYSVQENFTRNANRPDLVTMSNPFPTELSALGGTTSTFGADVDTRTGYLQSYNLTVERDLGGDIVLEIGYSGSKGSHLGKSRDINYPRRTEESYRAGTPLRNLRPYSFYDGTINIFTYVSNSFYSAGDVSLRRRGRGGAFYRLSYSYSKSIDDASQLNMASTGGLVGTAQNPDNWKLDRGRSDWDRGHVVTASYSWMLPFGRGRRFFNSAKGWQQALIGRWQLSGTAFFATGAPFTVNTLGGNANLGDSGKPNRIGKGIPNDIAGKKRGVDYPWFVLSDFVAVPSCVSVTVGCPADKYGFKPFAYGNAGRSILDGPGLAYSNVAMMKNVGLSEGRGLQFRFEAFNALNQTNFSMPNKYFNSPAGGQITKVVGTGRGGNRVFQAALKFSF